jgi:hypothetical protein
MRAKLAMKPAALKTEHDSEVDARPFGVGNFAIYDVVIMVNDCWLLHIASYVQAKD